MSRRSRLLLPATMTLLLLGALAFAILASSDGSSGGSRGTTGTGGAAGAAGGSSGFAGAALPAGIQAPGFTLTDQRGARVSLASLRGGPVVLAFLYSTCGASCAVIAQQIRGALDELPRPVPVLIVSADPRADAPGGVERFLRQVSLAGRARWLTGTPGALRAVWRRYHVTAASAGPAAFARAATVTLLDGAGRERVLYGPEQLTPEALAHDIGVLEGNPAPP